MPPPYYTSTSTPLQINPDHQPKRDTEYITGSISIPSTYGHETTSPSPGVVAGIVLGSVAGFLFLLYLLYLALTSGRRFGSETLPSLSMSMSTATPSEIVDVGIGVVRGRHGRHAAHAAHRHRRAGGATLSASSRSVSRSHRGGRRQQVIVEEEIDRTTTDYDDDGDDVVEVVEEHSTVEGGSDLDPRVRRVDPLAYGGVGSEFSSRT